jgi:hypothetical protein
MSHHYRPQNPNTDYTHVNSVFFEVYRKTTLRNQKRVLDSVLCHSERQLDAEEGNKLLLFLPFCHHILIYANSEVTYIITNIPNAIRICEPIF